MQRILLAAAALGAGACLALGADCSGGGTGGGGGTPGGGGKKGGGGSGPGSGSFYKGLGEEHMFKPKPKKKPCGCPDDHAHYQDQAKPKPTPTPYKSNEREDVGKPYRVDPGKSTPYANGTSPAPGGGAGYETPAGSSYTVGTSAANPANPQEEPGFHVLRTYDPSAEDASQFPGDPVEVGIQDFDAPYAIYEGEDLVVRLFVAERGAGYPLFDSVKEERNGQVIRLSGLKIRRYQGSGYSEVYRAVAEHRVHGLPVGSYVLSVNLGSLGEKTQTVRVDPRPDEGNSLATPGPTDY